MRRLPLTALVIAAAAQVAAAPPEAPTFERDVRPILKAHCFQCHGEAGHKDGNFDVRLRRLLVAGGDSGPAVEPGDPSASYLLDRIKAGEMPPGEGAHLSAGELATLERWIAAGAPTARPEPERPEDLPPITEEERSHWAFRPVRRPDLPAVSAAGRVRTPVDAFLLARLEAAGLTFSPDVDRATLLRRATFDLTGLPPTPEEIDAFLADERSDAYERTIDRLLLSPRYGERWGRHWLDVAGYADSEGYNDADSPRDDAYGFRDYVIRSFNADKPFDRFLREQLAGDEILARDAGLVPPYGEVSPEAAELLAATGFLRMAPDGTGGKNDDAELAKQAVVAETVKVVSSGLLGLTVGCAECHDHRYDPVPQRDYYRLRAVFEPALDPTNWREPRKRRISLMTAEEVAEAARIETEAKAVEAELQPKLDEFRDWVFEKELEKVPQEERDAARAAGIAWRADAKSLTEDRKRLVEAYPGLQVAANPTVLNLFLQKYDRGGDLAAVLQENEKRAAAVRAGKPAERYLRALTEVPGRVPETFVFLRGDRTTPGETVSPGDLAVLSDGPPIDFPLDDPAVPTTGRRLRFAERLTDGSHPLTARVLANRFWMYHFGRGLVASPGDFGTHGERPSHPELLDWLADEFVASGWSLKSFHRLVMTSTAYRQASVRHAAGDAADPDDALYWRMPPRRLEAEAVRDAILAAAGTLNVQPFGPPVPVALDENGQAVVGGAKPAGDGREFRRSVYVQARRTAPAYLLDAFDAPQMEPNCERRNSSTVATQSLVLMNSEFVVDQAARFAARVEREAGGEPADRVRRAWRLAFGPAPDDEVVAESVRYLEDQEKLLRSAAASLPDGKGGDAPKETPDGSPERLALASLCQALLSSNRFLYVD